MTPLGIKETPSNQPVLNRREFLRNCTAATAVSLLRSSPDLHASNKSLIDFLKYQDVGAEKNKATGGIDIRKEILRKTTIEEWKKKTQTAQPTNNALGYLEDLALYAEYQSQRKDLNQTKKIAQDTIDFATTIKSARLATLLASASIAKIPLKGSGPIVLNKDFAEFANLQLQDLFEISKATTKGKDFTNELKRSINIENTALKFLLINLKKLDSEDEIEERNVSMKKIDFIKNHFGNDPSNENYGKYIPGKFEQFIRKCSEAGNKLA